MSTQSFANIIKVMVMIYLIQGRIKNMLRRYAYINTRTVRANTGQAAPTRSSTSLSYVRSARLVSDKGVRFASCFWRPRKPSLAQSRHALRRTKLQDLRQLTNLQPCRARLRRPLQIDIWNQEKEIKSRLLKWRPLTLHAHPPTFVTMLTSLIKRGMCEW